LSINSKKLKVMDYFNDGSAFTKSEMLVMFEAITEKLEMLEQNQKTIYNQIQDLKKNGLLSPHHIEQLTESLTAIQKESMAVYNQRLLDLLQNAQTTRTKLFEKVSHIEERLETIDGQLEVAYKVTRSVETSANKIYTWRTAILFALVGPVCGAMVATITVPWMSNSVQPSNSELMKRLTNIESKLKVKK
jgi:septation ring formation regulator EzrA